ncbi:hypothetical protein KBB05_05250 [Patescibacteria group bacterium]|nr:hypothetical protein [Patescibacteria group bacterium]
MITDYNLNSVNSIVFTTQQSRPLTTASAQARLNQRKQANSNFVATVVTQASSALGVTTSNP